VTARDGADTLLMLPTWTPRRPAVHLLPSFAPLTDAPLAFRFEVSALADGEWSSWAASATIGAADFAAPASPTTPLTCDVDVFRAAPAVDAVRLRVRVRAAASTRWIVALSAADDAPPDLRLPDGAAARVSRARPPDRRLGSLCRGRAHRRRHRRHARPSPGARRPRGRCRPRERSGGPDRGVRAPPLSRRRIR